MKHKYLPAVLICLLAATSSCIITQPISTHVPENNDSYSVDFLFEYDGCKVYRFYDRGNYVYFNTCGSEMSSYPNDSTIIRTLSGKNDNLQLPSLLK